jgi:hypothetical protein
MPCNLWHELVATQRLIKPTAGYFDRWNHNVQILPGCNLTQQILHATLTADRVGVLPRLLKRPEDFLELHST